MSISHVVFKCDRCATEATVEMMTPPVDWITAQRVDPNVGPQTLHFCKACSDSFVADVPPATLR